MLVYASIRQSIIAEASNDSICQRSTLPATREFKTLNSTVFWKLGFRKKWIRIGPRSYKFRTVVLSSEYVFFVGREKSACGSWEDLPKPDTCQRMSKNIKHAFLDERQSPAAAGKTSPNILHVTSQNPKDAFFDPQKPPAAAGQTSPSLIYVIKPVFPCIYNSVGLYVLRIWILMAPGNKNNS